MLNHKTGLAALASIGLLTSAQAHAGTRALNITIAEMDFEAIVDDGDSMSGGGLASNALTPTALALFGGVMTGSRLGDLNGVVVEIVTAPRATEY